MTKNLFEEFQERKKNLMKIVAKAVEFGWITSERSREIINKLDNETLTIGVIGQMKCGKSTFLNSFVFESNVLPAATTPMTAALSVITYGDTQKIVAEFYTKDEWCEQRFQASRSLDDVAGNSIEESKIKAAKELVDKAVKLGTDLEKYLGKTQEDSFANLEEYVGADGKYISITKSVTIYYPKEYLKGVEIVDTPGFNDPIVSREERTKNFLKKADVVLLMLYAGRPFDATDRDILFKNVRQCGVGNVLIGINKYDIPYENGETEENIKNYVKDEINKASRELKDDTLKDVLKKTEPIPLSAEMALLSETPLSKIEMDETLKFSWKRTTSIFETASSAEIRKKSHIDDLILAIKNILEHEKNKILFLKPINSILAAGNTKMEDIATNLCLCDNLIKNLNTPDDELEEKSYALNKAETRLSKKIDTLGLSLNGVFRNIVNDGKRSLADDVDATCKRMHVIVDDWKVFSSIDSITPKLDSELQTLLTRTLRNHVNDLSERARLEINRCIDKFLEQAENILSRVFDDEDDEDVIDMKVRINENLQIKIDEDLFKMDSDDCKDDFGWGDIVWNFLNGCTYGILEKVGDVLSHKDNVLTIKNWINSLRNNFDPTPLLETIYQSKEQIVEYLEDEFIRKYINPMQKQIETLYTEKESKETQLQNAKDKMNKFIEEKKRLTNQINEIKQLKDSLI